MEFCGALVPWSKYQVNHKGKLKEMWFVNGAFTGEQGVITPQDIQVIKLIRTLKK